MAADPNQNKAKIDTSQLKFNVNDEKTKLIATYNDEEAAFIEFTISGLNNK